jgi:hypothetical protein
MSTMQGGRICTNANGDMTSYFKTYQGLMQRDPLSPIIFNLVADTLSTLMSRAPERGTLEGW